MTRHDLAMALRVAYLTMHRKTDRVLAPAGVTADQFVVLAALAEAGALSQQELAEKTASDRNTLRAMVLLLEKQALLARTPDPHDGRRLSVALTAQGRKVYRKLCQLSEALRLKVFARMPQKDADTLVKLLRQFAASLSGGRPAAALESASSSRFSAS